MAPDNSTAQPTQPSFALRAIKDGPFSWQSKAALRRIREVAGESNRPSAASVIAVYVGLCELASDSQSEAFQASRGHIAGKACVNVRTADAALSLLEKCELVRIERRRIDETTNLPSEYILLRYSGGIKSLGGEINSPLANRQEKATTAPFLKNPTEESEKNPVEERREAAPLPFDSPEFAAAWADFEQHRRELKKKLTPTAIRQNFADFKQWGEARAIAAIRFTIGKGWQGIREDRDAPRFAPPAGRSELGHLF